MNLLKNENMKQQECWNTPEAQDNRKALSSAKEAIKDM